MEKSGEIVLALKEAMLNLLSEAVGEALDAAYPALMRLPGASVNCGKLKNDKQGILDRFRQNAAKPFDELLGTKEEKVPAVLDYANLSLVAEDDLEAIIALEGMVSYARNADVTEYIKFNTRLDTLFFNTRIDESNSPMDPEQIGDAFQETMRPVSLKSTELLGVYREFNKHVFRELEKFLAEANRILKENGVLPDLGAEVRIKKIDRQRRVEPRPQESAMERAFADESQPRATNTAEDTRQMYSLLQKLMHTVAAQSTGAATAPQGSGVTPVTATATGQPQLASVQSMITGTGASQVSTASGGKTPAAGLYQGMMIGKQRVDIVGAKQVRSMLVDLMKSKDRLDSLETEETEGMLRLNDIVGDVLQQSGDDKTLKAIDSSASDTINLMHLLFEFIANDETVPSPMKSILGRTQIPLLIIALEDSRFFDNPNHAGRELVNELSTAGISWTESEKLAEDQMYLKMQEIVEKLSLEFRGNIDVIKELVEELLMFKRKQLLVSQKIERELRDSDERTARLDEISQYAKDKIRERVLDPDPDPFLVNFLDNYFQKFLVKVIVKEGPGGTSWKPIMNTLDVLLWTMKKNKTREEKKRFEKVNPRLLANLRKALTVAGSEEKEADELLRQLHEAQKASHESPAVAVASAADQAGAESETVAAAKSEPEPLSRDDPHLQEVDKLPLGIWLEFALEGENTLRCSLAAKIAAIDKYVFVNQNGVKVIEKSRMGLARELQAGTVKLISQAPLFDRALESVISALRMQAAGA